METIHRRARDYHAWWTLLGSIAFAVAFISKFSIQPDYATVGIESFGGAGFFMLAAAIPAGITAGIARLLGKRLSATQWLSIYTGALAVFCYFGWVLSTYKA